MTKNRVIDRFRKSFVENSITEMAVSLLEWSRLNHKHRFKRVDGEYIHGYLCSGCGALNE